MASLNKEDTKTEWLLGSETVAEYEQPRNRVGKRRLFNLLWWVGQSILWNVIIYSIFIPNAEYGIQLGEAHLNEILFIGLLIQTIIHATLVIKYFPKKRGNVISIALMPFASIFGIVFFSSLPWFIYEKIYGPLS